jgi:TolB protein
MKLKTSSKRMRRVLQLALIILLATALMAWYGSYLLDVNPLLAVSPAQVTASRSPEQPATPEPDLAAVDFTTATLAPSPSATNQEPLAPITLMDPASAQENIDREGLLVLSMRDGLYSHLFAYHPLYLPLTRITDTPWDDITPAVSPDGTLLAFSSRANGYWDLYTLNLTSGQRTRLTDTPEFESSPSWSPDGQWIVYERFNGANYDLYLLQINGEQEPIQLTDDAAIDRSPAWAQQGRQIAFTSTRSGEEEIWLANLDNVDERFTNLSANTRSRDRSPVWSPDGSLLAWTAEQDGMRQMMVWNAARPDQPVQFVGEGDQPIWSPDGTLLLGELRAPNESGLAAYHLQNSRLAMPYARLPGALYGFTWVTGPMPAWLAGFVRQGNQGPPPTLTTPVFSSSPAPQGRKSVIELPDVNAPQPRLHDAVDEAFNDLRRQVAQETGWDALSSLENAFVALTTPPTPSIENDWLYTGRAFTLNPLLLSANWMVIAREDYGGLSYWRVYLKARFQDGSMGKPLAETIWDLNARYAGIPAAYEAGGWLAAPPHGYWIDLTELAARYGWGRTPSLTNWRTFYPAIRYNQFVITGGMSWNSAMAEIYPAEALATITPQPTYTLPSIQTSRGTPVGTRTPTRTSTQTPTITQVPTRRPTWTPLP